MKFKAVIAALAVIFSCVLTSRSVEVHAQATLLPLAKQCFQATAGINGMVGTLGPITGGSGYVNGSYGGVSLTGGSGSNATANITVSGGIVTGVAVLNPGTQYVVGDVLSASAASIGGTGGGFSVSVLSTSINSAVAGGSVAYYIPGTLTTKQTWQDSGETILNSQPVQLDQNGCATVYGSGTYRQVVKDSLGNTVWDQVTTAVGGNSGGGGSTTVGDGLAVGSILPWTATALPTNYLYAAGQPISRTTYSVLLTAITYQANIVCQSGIATITVPQSVSDGTPIGAPIEASCFAPGTTVSSKSTGLLTLSTNATTTVSTSMVIFPWGNADGAINFNVPDYRGRVLVGRDNMLGTPAAVLTTAFYGSNPDALNAAGGNQFSALQTQNLPPYTPSGSITNGGIAITITGGVIGGGGSGTAGGSGTGVPTGPAAIAATATQSPSAFNGIPQGGTSVEFAIIPPSRTADYIIKALPDSSISVATCLQLSDAGTACEANTGTAGHVVPFLDGTNTWGAGVQTIPAVAIAGGTITGMPNPTNASDVANKAYVDSVATGLNILPQSLLATAAILPNSPTYANGTLGVGATLTSAANSTLTVDGTVAALNSVVLVINQASAFQNGIYTVTTAGSGSAAWVLTRATYFDQAAEMKAGSYTFISGGTTNKGSAWTLSTAVATVGTSAVNFVLFSQQNPSGVTSIAGNTGAFTLGNGLTNTGNSLQTTRQLLTSAATFFISPSGNDGNTGTSSGSPWLTCSHAINYFRQNLDFQGFKVTLQFAHGSYSTANIPCVVAGPFVGADNSTGPSLILQGDTTQTSLGNPPNAVQLASTTSSCIQVQDSAVVTIQFMWLQCVVDLNVLYGGVAFVNNVIDDGVNVANSIHFLASESAVIELTGPMYLFQSGVTNTEAIFESKHIAHLRLVNAPFYLLSGVTVAVATAYNEDLGDITVTGTLESTGFNNNGFGIIGSCYKIWANSVLQWVGGVTTCSTNASPTLAFPGSSAGTTNLGGQIYN